MQLTKEGMQRYTVRCLSCAAPPSRRCSNGSLVRKPLGKSVTNHVPKEHPIEPPTLAYMSRAWKFHNPNGLYSISFATVGWVDVFTRSVYKDILVDSLTFCIQQKGLELFAWVLMTNHLHLIANADENAEMPGILRDLKKYTSKQVLKSIEENPQESRKEWMLTIFKKAGSD